jgi:Tfp pilus assembly protein PilE
MLAKMAYMSRTNDPRRGFAKSAGFTLVEIMMVTFISSFVFAGVLSAYIFLGRGLVRQSNAENLESRSRTTLFYFTQDISSASSITTFLSDTLVLSTPAGATVTYTFTSASDPQGNPAGTLTRSEIPANPNVPTSLLTGLSVFNFEYLDMSGAAPASSTFVKQISMTYTAFAGSAVSGAQSHFTVVSPWVIAKNKPSLL